MSDLWNPDINTKRAISAGERKIRMNYLKPELKLCLCPYCQRDVYFWENRHKYLTLGGSTHKCVRMPND